MIRWSKHRIGFHTDIKKMYNTVQLRQEYWCLQRYIWHRDLGKSKILEEKIIKTYKLVNQIVQNDIYVDDCLSGENTEELALEKADWLELVLNQGGFSLKGVTFSKTDPPNNLPADQCSVNEAEMKWFPKEDMVSLDIGELNFTKK